MIFNHLKKKSKPILGIVLALTLLHGCQEESPEPAIELGDIATMQNNELAHSFAKLLAQTTYLLKLMDLSRQKLSNR